MVLVPLLTSISDSLAAEGVINLISSTSATVTFTPPSGAKIDTPVYINLNNGGSTANVGVTLNIPGGTGFYLGHQWGPSRRSFWKYGSGERRWFYDMCHRVHSYITRLYIDRRERFLWANVASVLMATTGYGAAYSQGFDAVEASFVESGVPNTQYAGFLTPLPAALPLFAAGLGAMGLFGWRKKRKAQTLAAGAIKASRKRIEGPPWGGLSF